MAYQKTNWVDGQAPPLSAQNLNKIENGIESAHLNSLKLLQLSEPEGKPAAVFAWPENIDVVYAEIYIYFQNPLYYDNAFISTPKYPLYLNANDPGFGIFYTFEPLAITTTLYQVKYYFEINPAGKKRLYVEAPTISDLSRGYTIGVNIFYQGEEQ